MEIMHGHKILRMMASMSRLPQKSGSHRGQEFGLRWAANRAARQLAHYSFWMQREAIGNPGCRGRYRAV